MSETVRTPTALATPEQLARATSVVAIGASLVASWPAFTLGASGVVFSQQALSLWAAATAVFLVSLGSARRDRISWPQRLSLLIPSVWLVAAFLPRGPAPAGLDDGVRAAVPAQAPRTISGNDTPADCTEGPGTLTR